MDNCYQLFFIRTLKLEMSNKNLHCKQEFVTAFGFLEDYGFFQPIQRSIFFQQKRFRTRINIQKPKPYFYYKAQVMKFILPYYKHPNAGKDYQDICTNKSEKVATERTGTPYERIIGRELRQKFMDSKMIAILHTDSITAHRVFDFKVILHKNEMTTGRYGRMLMKLALTDTHFETLLQFLDLYHTVVFAKRDTVAELEKALKKFPEYSLLGGVLENKLLSRNEFLHYGKLDLSSAQAGLVHVLRSAGGNNLNSQLTHHQTTLISRLKQIGTNESSTVEKE